MLKSLSLLVRRFRRRSPPQSPTVVAIYCSLAAGEVMQYIEQAEAIAGQGLAGDRYCRGKGFWHPVESCQLTLITTDELSRARRRGDLDLDHGQHRRNLVVSGIKPQQLAGRTFRIGQACFVYHKPRPPCGYIDTVAGKGMARMLGRQSGSCVKVVAGGWIRVGDQLVLESPDESR